MDIGGDANTEDMVALPNGGALVVGARGGAELDAALVQLTPAGAADGRFDDDGVLVADLGSDDTLLGVELVSGGGIVASGTSDQGTHEDLRVLRISATGISDYDDLGGGSDPDWGGPGTTSMFGVCMHSLAGSGTADWTTTGSCTAADADPWYGIAQYASDPDAKVAHTASAGDTATANFRFGVRTATDQTPGDYAASILVQTIAPDA